MRDDKKIKNIYQCKAIEIEGKIYPLQKWYNELIEKKVSELEVSDVLRMIRQNVFLDIAISKSVEFLMENPFAGELYEGELLEKLSDVDISILMNDMKEVRGILSDALIKNKSYEWLNEEERKEFEEVVLKFSDKIEKM